jgi:hypothetical protein
VRYEKILFRVESVEGQRIDRLIVKFDEPDQESGAEPDEES